MKSKIRLISIVAVMALLVMTAATVFAESGPSFGPSGQGAGVSATVDGSGGCDQPSGPTTDGRCITHSTDQSTITQFNSVSCNAGGLHTDNSYMRRFTLADFGIADTFNVASVDVGIEVATGATGTQPVDVNLYTIATGTPLTFANLGAPIGTTNASVADQAMTVLNIPVTGAAPAGADLVVEIFTPDGQTLGNSFFIGSNPNGQTGPTYLAAAACGVAEPTDTGAIGFPTMHMVLMVNGKVAGGPSPSPEGKTYEVTQTGSQGPADCWTFNADGTFTSSLGLGQWRLKGENATKARWVAQVGGSTSGWRVQGLTRLNGALRATQVLNGTATYSGIENASCGAP
jgi:hypothetical protein